eukprot:COSAG04_NODE_1014_length_8762_cov_31.342145_8_plen_58_part_00
MQVLFPFNFFSYELGGVGAKVLAAAQARKMGVLALKSMARCRLTVRTHGHHHTTTIR